MNNLYLIILIILTVQLILSCLFLLCSQNLILTVLLLVLFVLSGIFTFPFFNAEYLMVVFLIVYLGAIVVFFIFVIMLIDVKNMNALSSANNIYNFDIFLYSIILIFFYMILLIALLDYTRYVPNYTLTFVIIENDLTLFTLTNADKIGLILFTDYGLVLIICGSLMFVVILGAIAILKNKKNGKEEY